MQRPSIFQQLPGSVQVDPDKLLPSPRHWNSGMIRFGGKLYLAYRHHRSEAGSRCAIAITELNEKTLKPGKSFLIPLTSQVGGEHYEDPRLFIHRSQLHVSYTEMRGYRPGVDYQCVVRYSRLRQRAKGWDVMDTYQPRYGKNDGFSKEKNWVFFESGKRLYCVYSTSPKHVVLEIDEGKIMGVHTSPAPHWVWGTPRGGASPVLVGDRFLHVFHSSLPTETAPHYVRYYAGAYTFQAKAPFAPIDISARPFAQGSEEDGHQVDPRYVEGWKPFVVFPCGIVPQEGKKDRWLVSMGVNDWQTVISPVSLEQMKLMPADGSEVQPRFFMTSNGNRPTEVIHVEGQNVRTEWINWEVPALGLPGGAGTGYLRVTDERVAEELLSLPHVEEIDQPSYLRATGSLAGRP